MFTFLNVSFTNIQKKEDLTFKKQNFKINIFKKQNNILNNRYDSLKFLEMCSEEIAFDVVFYKIRKEKFKKKYFC